MRGDHGNLDHDLVHFARDRPAMGHVRDDVAEDGVVGMRELEGDPLRPRGVGDLHPPRHEVGLDTPCRGMVEVDGEDGAADWSHPWSRGDDQVGGGRVGANEPAGSQLDAAEPAGDDDGRVGETAGAEHVEHRHARGAGGSPSSEERSTGFASGIATMYAEQWGRASGWARRAAATA